MSPIHHRLYKRAQAPSQDVTENMALLLEQAALHMNYAKEAIDRRDVEERFNQTQKASFIMSGLKAALVRDTPSISRTASALEAFYSDVETLIMRVNIFNNADAAKAVATSLIDVARQWRHIGAQQRATMQHVEAPMSLEGARA